MMAMVMVVMMTCDNDSAIVRVFCFVFTSESYVVWTGLALGGRLQRRWPPPACTALGP